MYIPVNFNTENNKHNVAIAALKNYYTDRAVITELPGKNTKGYDLEIVFNNNPDTVFTVEMKSNAGKASSGFMYNTWLLETYADHEMNKMPEWRTTEALDFLIIFNTAQRKAYIYDVQKLRSYVNKNEARQVPSGVGTGQYGKTNKLCSWGLKIDWNCEEAGCIKVLDLRAF